MPETIRVLINGEPQQLPVGMTVAELLQHLQREPRFLAVERNFELIPRTQHAACRLQADDQIEIVTLVGGG